MAELDREDVWRGIGDYPAEVTTDGTLQPRSLNLLTSTDARASEEHTARVIERYAELRSQEAGKAIDDRARAIQFGAPGQQRLSLIRAAAQARTTTKRIEWLRREADLVVRAAHGQAACREGCSSCCHLAVAVSEQEARLIARETGLPMKVLGNQAGIIVNIRDSERLSEQSEAVAEWGDQQGRLWKGVPCPFLKNDDGMGRCSIYAQSRPLECRNLINLDRDDLLCKLVEGVEINVPYLSRADAKAAAIDVLGGMVRIADIRDWFGVEPVWPLVG